MKIVDIIFNTVVITILSMFAIMTFIFGDWLFTLLLIYVIIFFARSEWWRSKAKLIVSMRQELLQAREQENRSLKFRVEELRGIQVSMQRGIDGLSDSNKKLKAELEFVKTSRKLEVRSVGLSMDKQIDKLVRPIKRKK